MQELMAVAHASIRAFFGECDRIVTLCQWATSVLLRNGIPPDKVILCRIGLPDEASVLLSKQTAHLEKTEGPLRCVFLGGFRPEKGLHILIQSVASAPSLPVELHIHGRTVNAAEDRYVQTLRALAQGDPRIHFHGPIPDREVVRCLREYDVAIVPSQCLETGPFVVLEAFAAGLPVVGSNLGGIAELVRDGIDGLLVEPTSLQKWQNALTQLASDRTVLDRLRSQVRVSRTMADVAAEMEALYQSLLAESSIA
jgi:glycosyltransferase involved in cell wall biosynthesis